MSFRLLMGCSVLAISVGGAGLHAARAGETINYTYDSLGRLVAAKSTGTVNNNQVASYCYDAAGNRFYAEAVSTGTAANCATAPTPTPTPTSPRPPSLSINSGSTTEGGTITFTVLLSAAHTTTVTVDYATALGTALGGDFYATSGTLTFTPGQTSKSVAVTTKQDTKVENSESFYVNLANATGGSYIAHGSGVGTIFDDDESPCPLC